MSGYSPNFNLPAYGKYKQSSSKGYLIKLIIIAVVAGGLLAIMDKLLGVFVGVVIIAGGLFQMSRSSRGWDGVIQAKDQMEFSNTQPDGTINAYIKYELKVERAPGKVETLKWTDNSGAFEYYRVGEQVRHHPGCDFPEKFDKSNDEQVICVACGELYDLPTETCPKCQVPLLK